MKKRLFAFVMALLMLVTVFTLCSCEKEETAYELLERAMEKTTALNSLNAAMDAKIVAGAEGVSFNLPFSGTVQATDLSSEMPRVLADLSMQIPMISMTVSSTIYYEEDYLYIDLLDQNVKLNLPRFQEKMEEEYPFMEKAEKIETEETSDMLEQLLRDVPIENNEDGTKTIRFVVPSSYMMEAIAEETDSMSAEDLETLAKTTIEDVTFVVTISEQDYVQKLDIAFAMCTEGTAELNDEAVGTSPVDLKMEMSITINDPGQDVTVTPPVRYKDYEEITPEAAEEEEVFPSGVFM